MLESLLWFSNTCKKACETMLTVTESRYEYVTVRSACIYHIRARRCSHVVVSSAGRLLLIIMMTSLSVSSCNAFLHECMANEPPNSLETDWLNFKWAWYYRKKTFIHIHLSMDEEPTCRIRKFLSPRTRSPKSRTCFHNNSMVFVNGGIRSIAVLSSSQVFVCRQHIDHLLRRFFGN